MAVIIGGATVVRRTRAKKACTPWQEYERRKKKLQNQGLTSREYEAAVQAMAKKMNL